ncbi:hypothetical protein BTJ45_04215 [Bacillus mycoides]|nr:hypothetical protein BTJ45_04215 [Bacillus mycoides]
MQAIYFLNIININIAEISENTDMRFVKEDGIEETSIS